MCHKIQTLPRPKNKPTSAIKVIAILFTYLISIKKNHFFRLSRQIQDDVQRQYFAICLESNV